MLLFLYNSNKLFEENQMQIHVWPQPCLYVFEVQSCSNMVCFTKMLTIATS